MRLSKLRPDVPRNQSLKCEVKDGVVTISIGVQTLAWCTKFGLVNAGQWPKFAGRITNDEGFCREMLDAIEQEREDGSNKLTDLLDQAALDAIDNGSQYVNFLHKGKVSVEGLK